MEREIAALGYVTRSLLWVEGWRVEWCGSWDDREAELRVGGDVHVSLMCGRLLQVCTELGKVALSELGIEV
eukprot:3597221-Rhodomonas_salina.1